MTDGMGATTAIRAGGKRFLPHQSRVIESRLIGVDQTVANGTLSNPFRMQSVSNVQYIRDYNEQIGGTTNAIALGVAFRIRYSYTLPATGADPSFRATANLHERYALSTMSIKPGKAGQGYTMSRGETSIGGMLRWIEDTRLCSQTMKAARIACDGYQSTRDRNAINGDGLTAGSIDNVGLVGTRTLVGDEQRRVVASGTAAAYPETGEQYEDIIFFPLTADGSLGVHTSGFSIEELFDATNTWEFQIRPVFDTGIHAAGAALVGDFDIKVSLIWRCWNGRKNEAAAVAADPIYGKVWQWNNAVGTVTQGTLQVLSGPAVQNHIEVGYPSIVYGEAISGSTVPVVDGTNYFFQELIPGSGTAVKCRLMPCNVPPSSLNNDAVYLQVGREGGRNTLPQAGWNLARGNEMIRLWNDQFRARAIPGHSLGGVRGTPYGTHSEGREFPMFTDTGVRLNANSFVTRTPSNSVYYGTAWGVGGAAVPTIQASNQSSITELGLGGFLHYPIAFSDREVDGFTGLEVRAAGDTAGISVLTFGGFQLPVAKYSTTGAQNPAQVNVMRILTDYAHFSTDPCACDHEQAKNFVFKPMSPNVALGDALTTSVVVLNAAKPNVTA